MKILVVSNPHKGFCTSTQAGNLIRAGILRVRPNWSVDVIPIGDGGEGTVESLTEAWRGSYREVEAFDPLCRPVQVRLGFVSSTNTAIVECWDTAGAGQMSEIAWNTLYLSSFGFGSMLRKVAQMDVRHIVIGLGGSVISDGGLGMAQALGARFYDHHDCLILPEGSACLSCVDLAKVCRIDTSEIPGFILNKRYTILADVSIPLLGPGGQAQTFGPQKKATPEEVEFIESSLSNWNRVLSNTFNDSFDIPLAGAAGGLGAGLRAFLSGHLYLGIDYVLDQINFDDLCEEYDIVITGEGRLDRTTALGKGCWGVAQRCQRLGKTYGGVFGYVRELVSDFTGLTIDASRSMRSPSEPPRFFSLDAIMDAASELCNRIF